MTVDDIVALANAVYLGMNGNPAFPNPPVTMAIFRGAIDNCAAALLEALDGSGKAIARRKEAEEILKRMLRQLAHYVQHNCNDDMPTFLSSGFLPVSNART